MDTDRQQLPSAEALFNGAACGLLLTATDGTILRVNDIFCSWLGVSAAELTGKRRIQELLTMGGRVFHQTHWAPLMQIQGSVAEVKLDLLHRDGHKVPMLFNAVRRTHGAERFDELAVVVVTDRAKYERELLLARQGAEAAQEQLAGADRRKDEFLATLAHELRNPLAPIRNVVQILKRQTLADPTLVWSREVLERQVKQMTHLVDDLLEVSRITQGKLELRKKRIDLVEALKTAVESAQPLIDASAHELTLALPPGPVMLQADATRVVQMVLNLLNNAAKYTPIGGRIWLSAEVQGPEVLVSVRDSGIGIAAAHLPGVFEMFAQIPSAAQRSEGGLGIGLALVKGLVELHGGRVSASSAGAGQGCEFLIRLPLIGTAAVAPAPAQAPAAAPPAPGSRRIVVVDDNVDAAESLSMYLEMQGHQLRFVHDGLAAVAAVEAFRPDIVLLDIGLPGIDGFEVARRLRAQPWGATLRLIALTGWGQQQDRDATAHAGFDHHLTKPVELDELEAILGAAR